MLAFYSVLFFARYISPAASATARLAQSVERKALNLVVVGSSPTVGAFLCFQFLRLPLKWMQNVLVPLGRHTSRSRAPASRKIDTCGI